MKKEQILSRWWLVKLSDKVALLAFCGILGQQVLAILSLNLAIYGKYRGVTDWFSTIGLVYLAVYIGLVYLKLSQELGWNGGKLYQVLKPLESSSVYLGFGFLTAVRFLPLSKVMLYQGVPGFGEPGFSALRTALYQSFQTESFLTMFSLAGLYLVSYLIWSHNNRLIENTLFKSLDETAALEAFCLIETEGRIDKIRPELTKLFVQDPYQDFVYVNGFEVEILVNKGQTEERIAITLETEGGVFCRTIRLRFKNIPDLLGKLQTKKGDCCDNI